MELMGKVRFPWIHGCGKCSHAKAINRSLPVKMVRFFPKGKSADFFPRENLLFSVLRRFKAICASGCRRGNPFPFHQATDRIIKTLNGKATELAVYGKWKAPADM